MSARRGLAFGLLSLRITFGLLSLRITFGLLSLRITIGLLSAVALVDFGALSTPYSRLGEEKLTWI